MRSSDWSSDVCSSDLLFGILGYVEPVLLFWVAFLFLHEAVSYQAWFTYVPIWIAVVLIAGEGAMVWRQFGNTKKETPRPRSEERRVGKEGVSTLSSRWSRYH